VTAALDLAVLEVLEVRLDVCNELGASHVFVFSAVENVERKAGLASSPKAVRLLGTSKDQFDVLWSAENAGAEETGVDWGIDRLGIVETGLHELDATRECQQDIVGGLESRKEGKRKRLANLANDSLVHVGHGSRVDVSRNEIVAKVSSDIGQDDTSKTPARE